MTSPRSVLLYREDLLSVSETFVLSQGEALRRFTPIYVGTRRVAGLPLPEDRQITLGKQGPFGRARRIRHMILGASSSELRTLRQHNPSLIHAHFGPDGTRAMIIAKKLGIPLVVTFHGYDINVMNRALLRQDWKLAFYLIRRPRLKAFHSVNLAVSDFIRRKLIRKGFPPDKVLLHYIGVDTELFRPDPRVQRDDVVLFVGRLVENKGCQYFLRAMCAVQAIHPGVSAVVIGDGPLRGNLEQLASDLGLVNCRFLGSLSPESVRQWMNRSRVFCVPSVELATGASEGFGLVFAEAQSMGLPVVSFQTGGIPEAVENGETGFLVKQRDTDALAKKLLVLFRNQSLWLQFSHSARRRVETWFDLRTQTEALEQIYDEVLQNGNAPFMGTPREPLSELPHVE